MRTVQRNSKFIKTQSFKSEDQKGYTKRSRGRSFFIQILTELTIQLLLKRLNLTRTSIVMSAGGHFYLIAPNTTQNKQIIETTYCEINEFLISTTDKLNLTLESVEADKNSFKPENLQELLATINKKSELKKFERLFNEKMYENIFEKEFEGKECKSCGFKEISYKNKDLCEMCSLAENIGQIYNEDILFLITEKEAKNQNNVIQLLKRRPFQDLGDITIVPYNNNSKELLPKKGFVYCFADYQYITKEYSKNKKLFSFELLKKIEDLDISIDFNFKPSGEPLELEKMAKIDGKENTAKLAHFKMDVDNLGKIIKKAKTISQISTISDQLLLFFSKKVSELVDKKSTYTVFIGGDDLYLISRYDKMLSESKKIVEEFQNFYNNQITVSGGMNILHHAFPMNVAIEIAQEEIDKAKNYSTEKNSISFLEKQVNWSDWFEVLEFAEKLKSSKISTNQIYRLMKLLEKNQNKSRKIHIFYYILGRLKEDKDKKDEKELKIIKEFENKILESTMNNTNDNYTKKIILIIKLCLLLRRIDIENGVDSA
ncbi:MAG: type III-A CRISPR-associated protein Cas10/Csm1 [Candidatus Diapherotrites archaeon]